MWNDIKEKINWIFKICLEIQTETEYWVFFNLSWHVDWLNISICNTKEKFNSIIFRKQINLDYTDEVNEKELKKLEKQLNKFLN